MGAEGVGRAITGNLGSSSVVGNIKLTDSVRGDVRASATTIGEPSLSPHANIDDLTPSTTPFLTITVLGATGDLATSKIFPALFALYYSGHLPEVHSSLIYLFFIAKFQLQTKAKALARTVHVQHMYT